MKKLLHNRSLRTIFLLVLTFVVVQLLIMANIINSYYHAILATVCINIVLAVSLNLITGFTGQFSLGHAGFMSVGAYACALITLRVPGWGGFLLGAFAGAAAAAILGLLVGLPTLRLRGDYLAIATLGFSEIIRIIFTNLEITNGAAGLNNIPQHMTWPSMFVFTAGTVLIIRAFLRSAYGRSCIAIREDEIAAEAMGVNTTKFKVLSFITGAFFAGLAGAMYASYFYFLRPDTFGFLKSIDILVIVVLGGLGSLSGSIVSAIFLGLISMFLQSVAELRMVIYSLLLVLIMLFRPQGLMGTNELSFSMLKEAGGKILALIKKRTRKERA